MLADIDDKLPRDSNVVTPLHIAAERKHFDIFDLFLENIKIHPMDNQGRSPSDIMRSHSDHFFGFDKN
jgi:ankyrin repeat protein